MPVIKFPNDLGEVASWSTTTIMVNNKIYTGVQGFKGPDTEDSVENVYGQGVAPVGYSYGNQEPQPGSIEMLYDSYVDMLNDLVTGEDKSDGLRNIPITIVKTYAPDNSTKYKTIVKEYHNVQVMNNPDPEDKQGETSLVVTLNLQFTQIPIMKVIK